MESMRILFPLKAVNTGPSLQNDPYDKVEKAPSLSVTLYTVHLTTCNEQFDQASKKLFGFHLCLEPCLVLHETAE